MVSVTSREWVHNDKKKSAWTVRYKDETGAYRSRQFRTKKLADAYRVEVEGQMAQGDHVAVGRSKSLAFAVAEYLDAVDAKAVTGALRESTARNYRYEYPQAIPPGLADKPMIEIESRPLELWFNRLVRHEGVTPVTAYRRLKSLALVFDFAGRRRWVRKGQNPAREAMKEVGSPKRTVIELFEVSDVRRLIAAVDERPFRGRARSHAALRVAVNLAAFCGMRWGEIFGLTRGNVDLDLGIIRIRQGVDQKGKLDAPETKAGVRQIHIPTHVAALLADFLATFPTVNEHGIILTSDTGRAQTISSFHQTLWYPLQSRAAVQDKHGRPIRFHALRHFACSWMIDNNWPITEVSRYLGHANVTVTLQVYAHALGSRTSTPDATQHLAEKLLSETVKHDPIALLSDATVTQAVENAEFSEA